MFGGVSNNLKNLTANTSSWLGGLRSKFAKLGAEGWAATYNAKQRLEHSGARMAGPAFAALVVVLGLVALGVAQTFQTWISPFYVKSDYVKSDGSPNEHFQNLRTLAQALGGAMIGVAGIAFTLVMFSIQTNVERLPHGLFRKLSADAKLLLTFLLIFILAAAIAVLSLVQDTWLGAATLAGAWALIALVGLLWYAYDRAHTLVNPNAQLHIIRRSATREFSQWSNRATRLRALYAHADDDNSQIDGPRFRFFSWTYSGRAARWSKLLMPSRSRVKQPSAMTTRWPRQRWIQ